MNEKTEKVRKQAVADFSVVVERLDNVKEKIECNHQENKEEHEKIMEKQDYTNGKVKSLQIWKATMAGALIVISIISGYIINDYIANRKESSANYEIIRKNSDNIQRMLEQ